MDDDGVDLVALNHSDIEKTGIFGVHGAMNETAVAVAMVLRRLNDPHMGVGERRRQVLEPIPIDHIVSVDDTDDLSIRRRLRDRKPERGRLESCEVLHANELKARAKVTAPRFDRLPESRVRGVVDDYDAFEIRVIEPRH